MAFNLALGVRLYNETPICLITTKGNLQYISEVKKQYFNHIIELDPKEYTVNGKQNHVLNKFRLFELSPFEETIYLDADSVWSRGRNINDLFEQFKAVDFGFTTYNENEYFPINSEKSIFWCKEGNNINDFNKFFKFKKDAIFYHVQASFLYFKKTEKAKQIFDKALEVFLKRDFDFREWADGMADELAFDLALALLNYKTENHYSGNIFYYPLNANKKVRINDLPNIYKNYFYISLAGHQMHNDFISLYDRLVKYYSQQDLRLGTSEIYLWKNKADFLTERKNY
jgi:hypothetical protein